MKLIYTDLTEFGATILRDTARGFGFLARMERKPDSLVVEGFSFIVEVIFKRSEDRKAFMQLMWEDDFEEPTIVG